MQTFYYICLWRFLPFTIGFEKESPTITRYMYRLSIRRSWKVKATEYKKHFLHESFSGFRSQIFPYSGTLRVGR